MPVFVDPQGDEHAGDGTDARIDDSVTQHQSTPLAPSGDELPPMPPGHRAPPERDET
jgi:hypothetical protein